MTSADDLRVSFQLQTLGAQNALWQSQLAAAAVANSNNVILGGSRPTMTPPPVSSANVLTSNTGGGFAASDLQALQMALHHQQRTLQQQLQSFLLMQQPNNVQTSAMLLQSQVSQAVSQATNQLKLLQKLDQNKNDELVKPQALPDTPKSIPRSPELETNSLNDRSRQSSTGSSNVKLALSNLTPIPPPPPLTSIATSANPGGVSPPLTSSPRLTSLSPPEVTARSLPTTSSVPTTTNGLHFALGALKGRPLAHPPPSVSPQFPPPGVPRLDLPADENVDLEELEQFAKEFKQRRIKLGR